MVVTASAATSGPAAATGNSTYHQIYTYTLSDGSNGQYGNMVCTTGCTPANWTWDPGTNHLAPPSSYPYDAAGNLTTDGSTGHTYQWDAEGRVSSVDNGSTWSFTYNAVGDRVQWARPGGADQHIFDPAGNSLGVYGGWDVIWLGGRVLAVYEGSETYFFHANHLNSTSVATNHAGTAVEDILFYPWGQNTWRLWGTGGYSFTGMPYYDTNTNTNPTNFRFYSQNLGRWHSPDPMGGDITNPQSLNRYAYVLNNPCSFTDPLGLQQGCGQNPLVGPGSDAASLGSGDLRPGGGGWFGAPRGGGPHKGVDLSAEPTSPVYPMLPGTVTKVGEGSGGAGLMVEVNAGGGYTYDYMHLTTAFVYKGEQLTADTMVGLTGTSGNAANLLPSEAHLHLQINEQIGIKKRPTDPFNFMGNPCPHGVVNFVRTGGGGSGWFGGPSWWQQWALYQAGNLALTFAEEQSQTNEPKGSASSKITGWWPLE